MGMWDPAIEQDPCPDDMRRLGRALWSLWKLKPSNITVDEYFSASLKGWMVGRSRDVETLIMGLWTTVWQREADLLKQEAGDTNA